VIATHTLVRAAMYIAVAIASRGLAAFLMWLDRRSEARVMQQRIDSGSERFFIERADRARKAAVNGSIDLEEL
jgi:hypothetical protein